MNYLLDVAPPTFTEMYGGLIIFLVLASFVIAVTTYVIIKLINKNKKSK